VVREQQLFVKNGSLFGLESSQWSRGFVLDQYNGQTFMTALNDRQELKDFADPLKTPENFSRKHVAHMSNTLDSGLPYLLVRYETGEAKGFNYVTGEELPVENAFSDISLFDFAADFMKDLIGQESQGNQVFADLKVLKEKLILNPVTDEQLEAAVSVMEGQTDPEVSDSLQTAGDKTSGDLEPEPENRETDEEIGQEKWSDEGRQDVQGEYIDGSAQQNGIAVSDGYGAGDGSEDVNGSSLLKVEPEQAAETKSGQIIRPDAEEQSDAEE
ncbi:MAG: hypothetical protein Q4C73_10040, partial [Eubacteriales bacterium]|nr:hypothetical protein [Eubacteriales bacterium]